MGAFTDVVSGQVMHASDVNQLVDAFNGTVARQLSRLAPAGNGVPWTAQLPSGVAAGSNYFTAGVSGDPHPRLALYVNAGGYGCIAAGNGSGALSAHLEGASGGWTFTDYLTLANLTTTGSVSTSGISSTGNCTISGTSSTCSGASYNLAASNLISGGTWNVGTGGVSVSISDDGTDSAIKVTPTRAGTSARAIEIGGWSGSAPAYAVLGSTTGTGGGFNGTVYLNQYGAHNYLKLTGVSGFEGVVVSGSSGTISHGLGRTPDGATVCVGSTSTNDAWTGCTSDTWGSSTITIHLGAANYTISGLVFSWQG